MMHRFAHSKGDTLLERLHNEVHAWFLNPESIQDLDQLTWLRSILSSMELSQYRRFRFPEHAHLYLVSHGLVRHALSRYADINPGRWVFKRTTHGRPEITNPATPALRFNLTHTAGLAACVVTLSDDCGIDAEQIVTRHNPVGVAKRMFSETETRELEQLEGQAYLEHFFTRWTLREAYVKARGIGISFPTRKLTFTVDRDNAVKVLFHPDIEDKGNNWHFELLRPTVEHIAALAIRRNGNIEKKIVTRFVEF
ncbi:MAG: 4'-phosphopantetheinyl transferase superfamily protein [Thiogranum sp.]